MNVTQTTKGNPKKLHKIIQEKFRISKYSNVKEWHKGAGVPYSEFTCTRIINQDTEPALETAMVMLSLLGTTNNELVQICKDHGDKIWWRLIGGCDVSAKEMTIIEALRNDPEKEKIVRSILAL